MDPDNTPILSLMEKHGHPCISTPTYAVMEVTLVAFGRIYLQTFLQTDQQLLTILMPKAVMICW